MFCVIEDGQPGKSNPGLARPIDRETDWLAVAGNGEWVITLKADGSLWRWNFTDGLRHATATRLGAHSDWLAIAEILGGVVSLAADGSLWYWQYEPQNFHAEELIFSPLFGVSRKPQKLGNIFEAPDFPKKANAGKS